MIRIFKDGWRMAIATDAENETDFLEQMSKLLSRLIDKKEHQGDWDFQLVRWLPQIVNICKSYPAYPEQIDTITIFQNLRVANYEYTKRKPEHVLE